MPQTRTQAEDSLSWITARLLGEVGQQHRRRVILLRTTWISHYVTLGGRCWAAVTGRSQGLFTVTSSVWKCTVALERRTVTAPSHWGNHLTGSVSAGGHRGWTCGCRICSEEVDSRRLQSWRPLPSQSDESHTCSFSSVSQYDIISDEWTQDLSFAQTLPNAF